MSSFVTQSGDVDGFGSYFRQPKNIVRNYLAWAAHRVITRHKPYVIGVTGTVGKTTTTHFVYEFLSQVYHEHVYMSPHNYNGEWGLSLSILQSEGPWVNPFRWMLLLLGAFWMAFFSKSYPKYLVLEYGIDRIGEMDFLLSIVEPDVAVLLNISKNHIVNFGSFDLYAHEKAKIISRSRSIVYSHDDEIVTSLVQEALAVKNIPSISYGTPKEGTDIVVGDIKSSLEGISFDITYKSEVIHFDIPLVGKYQAFNTCPVVAIARRLSMPLSDIPELLKNVHPNRGRWVLLDGLSWSKIIDGSYNGWYVSIVAWLEDMIRLPEKYYRILLLWDMRELGNEAEEMHIKLADRIKESHPDAVYLVGPLMRELVYPRLTEAFSGDSQIIVESFLNSINAGRKIAQLLRMKNNDESKAVIYVKWSQNTIFLEEGIKEFLFDPSDEQYLPRQNARWKKKKQDFFDIVCSELTFGESDLS